MGNLEKLLVKLSRKKIKTSEFLSLLGKIGYVEVKSGKTSGSSRKYKHEFLPPYYFHMPHGRNYMLEYQCNDLLNILKKGGIL